MIEKICVCGKKFLVKPYRKDTAQWCSCECRFRSSDQKIKCFVCDNLFIRKNWELKEFGKFKSNRYCGRECFERRSPPVLVSCAGCGKKFSIYPSRAKYYIEYYCDNDCRLKHGVVGRLTDHKIERNRYQKFVRSLRHTRLYYAWRKKCLERDNYTCSCCDSDKKITVHHKKSMLEFVRKYGFNKELIEKDRSFFDMRNGQTLCRSCHFKEHKTNVKGNINRKN